MPMNSDSGLVQFMTIGPRTWAQASQVSFERSIAFSRLMPGGSEMSPGKFFIGPAFVIFSLVGPAAGADHLAWFRPMHQPIWRLIGLVLVHHRRLISQGV